MRNWIEGFCFGFVSFLMLLLLMAPKHSKEELAPQEYLKTLIAQGPISARDELSLAADIYYLSVKFSDSIITHIARADQRAGLVSARPKIRGFEKIGVDNAQLLTLWSEKYYPKHWIEGNLDTVTFGSKQKEGFPDYGIKISTAASTEDFKHLITIFGFPEKTPEARDATRKNLDWNFSHEIGHDNDWVNARYLSPRERVEFLAQVSLASRAPHAFRDRFGYVDSINNSDPQKEAYYKVREWWGSLCEDYFTFPDSLRESFPESFAFIDGIVKKSDPDFDTFTAKKKRDAFFKKIIGN
jgi:hypothetical protein